MYVCVCVCVCMCVCVCNLYTYNARTKRTIHFIARNDRREQVKENTRIDRFLSFRDRKQEKWKKEPLFARASYVVRHCVSASYKRNASYRVCFFRSIPEPEE